jgi:hypothetical protein
MHKGTMSSARKSAPSRHEPAMLRAAATSSSRSRFVSAVIRSLCVLTLIDICRTKSSSHAKTFSLSRQDCACHAGASFRGTTLARDGRAASYADGPARWDGWPSPRHNTTHCVQGHREQSSGIIPRGRRPWRLWRRKEAGRARAERRRGSAGPATRERARTSPCPVSPTPIPWGSISGSAAGSWGAQQRLIVSERVKSREGQRRLATGAPRRSPDRSAGDMRLRSYPQRRRHAAEELPAALRRPPTRIPLTRPPPQPPARLQTQAQVPAAL